MTNWREKKKRGEEKGEEKKKEVDFFLLNVNLIFVQLVFYLQALVPDLEHDIVNCQ